MGGEGREGDWECNGCGNRNYAFRSFCNRCKQPRLLVDTNTPPDSKWLPRIGDWICTGCTNNNYASREKCKKCGQPKEVAAMPVAVPGASLPAHLNFFARTRGGPEQNINVGLFGNTAMQQPLRLGSNWPLGGAYGSLHANGYGFQPALAWPSGGSSSSGVSSQGWRNGDWICTCGFHNYSSREQCKKCNAPMPSTTPSSVASTAATALGTKRLASEELVHNWDNKRLNAGQTFGLEQQYPVVEPPGVSGVKLPSNIYPTFSTGVPALPPTLQVNLQMPHVPAMPSILGKGAKQWRNGDWMCTNCNNHNYASRSHCNRCKTLREIVTQPVSVA